MNAAATLHVRVIVPARNRNARLPLVVAVALASLHLATVRCAAAAAAAGGQPPPPPPLPPSALYTSTGSYISTYDYLDVGRLLKNEKLVSAYIKCFLGDGPCTAEGRQVKAVLLPEVIRTVCSKCSPRQKDMARQVLKHIYYTRRSDFERIMKIYDTEGKYNSIIAFMNQK